MVILFVFAIGALISFIESKNNYTVFHSLWHICIFCAAGFGSLIKYKSEEKEIVNFMYTSINIVNFIMI